MSKIALGTVQFGLDYGISNREGKVARDEVEKILKIALDNGINFIDTAVAYGSSEQVLGDVGIGDFKIVSKIPPIPGDGVSDIEGWLEKQIEGSLGRLKADSLYGLLVHNTDTLRGEEGRRIALKLAELKKNKLLDNIGVSFYKAEDLGWITEIMNLDIVQGPLNLVDRHFEQSGWLDVLYRSGVEIHTRSSFLQGLLLMARDEIPSKFEKWSYIWDKWHQVLAEKKVNATRACMCYPLSLEQVNKVVVGVVNSKQLEELIVITRDTNDYNINDFSFLCTDDENLVNPSKWVGL